MKRFSCSVLIASLACLLLLSCQEGMSDRDYSIASSVVESSEGESQVLQSMKESDYEPPASPVLSDCTACGDGTVFLCWDNPGESDFYAVQVNCDTKDGNYDFPVLVKGLPASKGTIVITGLTNGTEYKFVLRSVDAGLNVEDEGISVSLTPASPEEETAPSCPEIVRAENEDGVIELEWTYPDSGQVFYSELYCDPAEGNLSLPVAFCRDQNVFSAKGLTEGLSHQFTLVTYSSSLKSSSVSTTATPQKIDLTPPEDVNLKAEVKNGAAVLTWKPVSDSDVVSYEVSWKENLQSLSASSEDSSLFSFSVADLEDGEEVEFTVRSVDTAGNRSEGAKKSLTFRNASDDALVISAEQLFLEEENVVEVTVQVETMNDNVYLSKLLCSYGYAKTANKVFHDQNAIDLTEEKSFRADKNGTYTIAAMDSYGNSLPLYVNIQGIDDLPPADVSVPSAFAGDGAVFLSWVAPEDEDLSSVQLCVLAASSEETDVSADEADEKDESSVVTIPCTPGEEMKYTARNLENGRPCTFVIKAQDKFGNVSKGVILSSIVPEAADEEYEVLEVENLSVSAGNSCATLTWSLPENGDIYAVSLSYREAGSGDFSYLMTVSSSQKYCNVLSLDNGVEYEFLLRSIDSKLRESEGLVSKTVLPTEDADLTPPSSVTKLYAQPSDKRILLSWQNPSDPDFVSVTVTVTSGENKEDFKQILRRGVNSLSLSSLNNGSEYTVSLVATDASGNKSKSSVVKATPVGRGVK